MLALGNFLRPKEHKTQFNRGNTNAFNWRKLPFIMMCLPTPWAVAACDAAISRGATVFAR